MGRVTEYVDGDCLLCSLCHSTCVPQAQEKVASNERRAVNETNWTHVRVRYQLHDKNNMILAIRWVYAYKDNFLDYAAADSFRIQFADWKHCITLPWAWPKNQTTSFGISSTATNLTASWERKNFWNCQHKSEMFESSPFYKRSDKAVHSCVGFTNISLWSWKFAKDELAKSWVQLIDVGDFEWRACDESWCDDAVTFPFSN